ncbi:MAG: hypothetical protein IJZ40_03305 [Bacteroidaceae bacterium]|nr:hypothetical protein [Bacteroidaceae bacterium]
MSEMKIENHFAQGAIVNNGQMNVGGGTIHVHVQGKEHVVEEQAENATCNPQPDKKSIIDYVMKLHPVYVSKEWQDKYEGLWKAILELPVVAEKIYDKGRQQNTTFNRNLVGNILHLMAEKKVLAITANATKMAEVLEGDANASVRAKLGEMPSRAIEQAVESLIG